MMSRLPIKCSLPPPYIVQGARLKNRCILAILQIGFLFGYNKDPGTSGIVTMYCLVLQLDEEWKGSVDG